LTGLLPSSELFFVGAVLWNCLLNINVSTRTSRNGKRMSLIYKLYCTDFKAGIGSENTSHFIKSFKKKPPPFGLQEPLSTSKIAHTCGMSGSMLNFRTVIKKRKLKLLP
jgi:hypothetical protein